MKSLKILSFIQIVTLGICFLNSVNAQETNDRKNIIEKTINIDTLQSYLVESFHFIDSTFRLVLELNTPTKGNISITKNGKTVLIMSKEDMFFHNINLYLRIETLVVKKKNASIHCCNKSNHYPEEKHGNKLICITAKFKKINSNWVVVSSKLTKPKKN